MDVQAWVAERMDRAAEYDRRAKASAAAFQSGRFAEYFEGRCNAAIERIRVAGERAEQRYAKLAGEETGSDAS